MLNNCFDDESVDTNANKQERKSGYENDFISFMTDMVLKYGKELLEGIETNN